jgi:hypothetical protein
MRQSIVLVWRGDLMIGGLTHIRGAVGLSFALHTMRGYFRARGELYQPINFSSPLDTQEE